MSLSFKTLLAESFPPPVYLEMPTVGIDISPLSIRFIEIIKNKKGFRVGKFGSQKFSTPFVFEDEKGGLEEVRTILKKWKKEHKLNFVEVSLPEEKGYLYKTEVPLGSDTEIRQTIEFGLEENVPISPAEAIFDYRIISVSEEDASKVKVVVTVLPHTVVQDYVELFESCELTPISFLIEAQALSRAIISREDKNTYLIVNIGELKTGIFIVSEGTVQFTSTLSIGGQDFNNAIMKQFKNTYEEADLFKKSGGFEKTDKNKEVFEALISAASVFKDEIEKIYIYWKTHGDKKGVEVDIHKIVLCGKDSLMKGFKEYLEENLRVSVEIGNVWKNISSFDEYIPPINAHDALDFGPAIGLAIPRFNRT